MLFLLHFIRRLYHLHLIASTDVWAIEFSRTFFSIFLQDCNHILDSCKTLKKLLLSHICYKGSGKSKFLLSSWKLRPNRTWYFGQLFPGFLLLLLCIQFIFHNCKNFSSQNIYSNISVCPKCLNMFRHFKMFANFPKNCLSLQAFKFLSRFASISGKISVVDCRRNVDSCKILSMFAGFFWMFDKQKLQTFANFATSLLLTCWIFECIKTCFSNCCLS